ncbi:DUF3581 family protein [Flocculibacter collagenilyticus]|uniref:DUF3581 family protein n=1 Tax=Flocculibacter collagenilyticus TaxID=2744479 RepID=UPI0018F7689B|nr:DUF3581 family protein [Flocculibacter collagenilyticus]
MFVDNFYTYTDRTLSFTKEQASSFAKDIANDFNPIHDVDAKRFCVPGDLLFSVTVAQGGLSQNMEFIFAGLVGGGVNLIVDDFSAKELSIKDQSDKTYLVVKRSGEICKDEAALNALIREYVAFSGENFPHILVPLMKQKDVMINPERPLVIYEKMLINLNNMKLTNPKLTLSNTELVVEGKRGNAILQFTITDTIEGVEQIVGTGEKHMVLSGLRAYQQEAIDSMVNFYNNRKCQLA